MDMEGGKPIIILLALIVAFVFIIGASIALTATPTPTPTPTPIPTVTPTLEPTPTPIPTVTPTPTPEPGDYPDATGQKYLWDLTNNTYRLVSPTPVPDVPDSLEDARALGWSPDLGDDADSWLYKYNLAHGLIEPRPDISFDILKPDGTPYDFRSEAIVLGSFKNVVFRINNNADYPYQKEIKVYANASLYYSNTKIHMENVIFEQLVSIAPHNYNDISRFWQIPEVFNGAPISTGVYDIVIELRNPDDGSTIYSKLVQVQVAKDPGNGYVYM